MSLWIPAAKKPKERSRSAARTKPSAASRRWVFFPTKVVEIKGKDKPEAKTAKAGGKPKGKKGAFEIKLNLRIPGLTGRSRPRP